MHVLIIGAAGMVGRKFSERIAATGGLAGQAVTRLTLADVIAPTTPAGYTGPCACHAVDLSDPAVAPRLIASRPDVIVHLAAIVSGEAEADFDKGYRINLDGTRWLFDAIRAEGGDPGASDGPSYCPRVVFTSSIAVFGAPFPEQIGDTYLQAPLTSYGTQKVMGELLLQDYTRRGFMDGIALRLPTICIRPGKPNKAASGFFSGILREPLAGQQAILPVPDTVRHWHASPRAAVGFLEKAATMDTSPIGQRRALTLPGLSATVAEQIEALRNVAGNKAVALIKPQPDPVVMKIVEGWPMDFDPARARALGFEAETSFDQIIRVHIEDELGGQIA